MDTNAIVKLVTFLGDERSLLCETVHGESGDMLYPPRNQGGGMLPYYMEGQLHIPLEGKDFSYWRVQVDPNVFGYRDMLRFAEVPPSLWEKYTLDSAEYPECKSCHHAVLNEKSKTGAQIFCTINQREGSIPACLTICTKRKLQLENGIDTQIPEPELKAFQAEQAQEKKRFQEVNEKKAKKRLSPKKTRRRVPVRRTHNKPPNQVKVAVKEEEAKTSLPMRGDAPQPRRTIRLRGRNAKPLPRKTKDI